MSVANTKSICPVMKLAVHTFSRIAAVLTGVAVTMTSFTASAQDAISHESWGDILDTYVSPGPDGVNLVDYGALETNAVDREKLDTYIAQFDGADIAAMERDAQFAAWSNLYTAVTVRYIVEKYPTDTIKPWYSTGPWKSIKVRAGDELISLHGIEHDVLRKQWSDDPRLHYAINCASYSCPDLRTTPWVAETLDADLNDAARAYVNHPRGVLVNGDSLDVSSIYKWFEEDFGGSEAAVIDHLLHYADADLAEQIAARGKIDDYDYDWSLNDTAK